jgi:prephenate dehydrogenase
MDPAKHDRLVASVSHLPHVTAALMVTLQTPAALELAGPGYRDSTRIAAGDPGLWRDILMDNRENVLASLGELRRELAEFTALLEAGDATAVYEYLASAAIKRGSPIRARNPMV